ncbi:F-box/RNI-like/FBD-like domains-containing protein [Arabidopsis thaliana]|uniref:F-box/RNI-like/FBD-like domains-containing protein n=1 Tax=Arabidopsis thaliana TaxID=3702 RepID=A0A1P8AS92_ARATH|nr:F-box/RNI-like/FBD-like domains-containing protein [Arabidopsis thaliana]ANM59516.1 F-box/RNI-like/FBD-like domains-containing protein [Arabidopsis thaliana]|eukprot:NP_001321870.1 F-box/RNI-like/FBD-like domains-containing protein [Arabidopsis thaliana]
MDEDGEKRVRTKRLCSPESSDKKSGYEVDWVRDLPESLICHVLLNLSTKDVIKNCVLSTKWRYLWRYVPGLDLDCSDFTEYNTFVSFVDRFLSTNTESYLNKFKLGFDCDLVGDEETGNAQMARWINDVVKRKVQHLDLEWGALEIPPIVYVCCLVLKSLTLCRSNNDNVKVLRVRSQSLLSFNYNGPNTMGPEYEELIVEIDTPKLQDLTLSHRMTASFIIKNRSSLVGAHINIEFNFCFGEKFDPKNLPKREMIRNFLVGISGVKNMAIAACTLEVIYDYSRCEPLPLFRNLCLLSVEFYEDRWEMLPFFLESCPNLKSLVVGSNRYRMERTSIISGHRCLLSSLEYVEIETPLTGEVFEMKLVSYLLENSPILKKLTIHLHDNSRKKAECEILTIPRRSSSCQVILL